MQAQEQTEHFNINGDDRKWNKLSEAMNQFHDWFKTDFNMLYQLADGPFEKKRISLTQYLQNAMNLVSHLQAHHAIEETHIFPILAQRMDAFSRDKGGKHLESHTAIHKGLVDLSNLVKAFQNEPSSYSPIKMKSCLDGFRDVLFNHLDEEVNDLRGTNLRKYFTLEEVESIGL